MDINKYNVKWNRQSAHSGESMPVGGFDTGLNVWVEQGDILFYIDRSGSFDENNQMLKLGRIRLRTYPNVLAAENCEFSQELKLEQGYIEIIGRAPGFPEIKVDIWAEVHRPAVHADVVCSAPVELEAYYESWRFEERELPEQLRSACFSTIGYPGKIKTKPDCVKFLGNCVLFYHKNKNDELLFDKLIEQQGLLKHKEQMWNPQRNFIFGGMLYGQGMEPQGEENGVYAATPFRAWRLHSTEPQTQYSLTLSFYASQEESVEEWKKKLLANADLSSTSRQKARSDASSWWHDYWDRSYISIFPYKEDPTNKPWQVGKNYNLFRYQLGCNAYGSYPTKFNGGLFTSDPYNMVGDYRGSNPDFRRWGGGSFTAQNQRLVYWPMLKSGDFDMMLPQFEYYLRALGNAELRTKVYWEHDGCSFTEQVENFGLPAGHVWGWLRSGDDFHRRTEYSDPTELLCPWIRYLYTSQLEFSYMILKYYQYSGYDISKYMPFIESAARFYDEHYQYQHFKNTTKKLDSDGHLVIYPSTACETYKDATNPVDAVAGLYAVVSALLELPGEYLPEEKRLYFSKMLRRIPPIKFRKMKGRKTIAPAESFTEIINYEIPQLYPVFPYDMYGVGREGRQVAVDTWHYGVDTENQKGHMSWHQDNIFCARLGLDDEAADYAIRKLEDSTRRFPTFWGPGHDWAPDHNWGGSGMVGLQDMLLQDVGEKIYIMPAWPRKWDVEFKLHATGNTVVEVSYKGGAIQSINVEPQERLMDVVICI